MDVELAQFACESTEHLVGWLSLLLLFCQGEAKHALVWFN